VAATNVAGPSAYSNTASVSVPATPTPPTGLTAALQAGPQVGLSWTDNATNETGFRVERSVNGGAFALLTTAPALAGTGTVTYVDTTVAAGNTYTYQVAATNIAGPSAYSNTASVGVPAAAPTSLTATLQAGPQVGLSWTDNATNETGFSVERSDNGGAFTLLATVPALAGTGTVTFVDLAVLVGNTYAYRVAATSIAGPSAYSNTASVSVATPAPPTGLTATLQAGPQVGLAWTDNATTETGFNVERSVNGGAFTLLTTVPALAGTGVVAYVDATVLLGNTYSYRVAATNIAGQSAYSNTASVSLPALPGKPAITSLAAASVNKNFERVTAQWGDVAGETSYIVQWSSTQAFTTVAGSSASLAANTITYTTGNLAKVMWWFRVGAVNTAGTVWSDPVSVAAAP
jgi:fibronectin type 3 domain-containing protein